MKKRRSGFYHSLVIIPDELYPFKTQVGGQWVRGIRAYNAALSRAYRRYGVGHYGFALNAYRQFFHFVGSILFLVAAAYLSNTYLGGDAAMLAFLLAAVALISYQEFYLHRKLYEQLWKKGVLDWLTWCVPLGVYFFMHFR